MKISGRHGRLRLRFNAAEAHMLRTMLDDLVDVLAGSAEDKLATAAEADVLARLYPAAFVDDDEAATEFRDLTESALRAERSERIEACRTDLEHAREIDISDADVARRWLQVLNDLRLAHGTRLGITEDDDAADLDPTDASMRPRLVYYWLTAVQDSVVQAVMR